MWFKLGFYTIIIFLFIFLIYKLFLEKSFVMNKRLGQVKYDSEIEDDRRDVVGDYITSGRLYRIPLLGKFYQKQIESLNATNIQMKPKEYLLASVGVLSFFFLIGTWVTGEPTLGLVLGVVGMLIPNLYVDRLKKKRQEDLNEQLPEFLNTLSNALRSGLSLQQGISISTEEALDPVKWEFDRLLLDMTVGRTTESSLNNLKVRAKNDNIDLLVNAISVQMDVGGNLSEVLDLLAVTIRENAKLQRYFKSTVAQNKLSGIIIGLLPVGLTLMLSIISPGYIEPLFKDSLGRMMLAGAVVMMGLGMFIIKKITEVEV